MAPQIPPPAKGMSPQQYYSYLTNQGVPGWAAYDAVTANFGTPQEARQRALDEQQEGPSTANQLGQAVGIIGGQYLGNEIATGGAGLGQLFGGGAATGAGTSAVSGGAAPSLLGGANILGGGGGAATTATGTGAGATTGMGSLAMAGPVAGGAVLAGLSAYNYNRNRQKYKSMGSGEAFREAAKDPMNWVLPMGLLGAAFGNKDRYLTERIRMEKLRDKGINIPDELLAGTDLNKGRSREELIELEKSKAAQGQYSNVKFAESRDEADLKPEDIWGYSAFFKKFGNDWLGKYSGEQRKQIAQAALSRGAVNEHHGTIDIKWTPELEKDVSNITGTSTTKPGSYKPGETAQSVGVAASGQPKEWSKEAQQRELARRLQRRG
jgi:hypothetical protein